MPLMEARGTGTYHVYALPDGEQTGPEEAHCKGPGGWPDGEVGREISRRSEMGTESTEAGGDFGPPPGATYGGVFL